MHSRTHDRHSHKALAAWIVSLVVGAMALTTAAAALGATAPAPTPPGNDEVANAQAIENLPATLSGTTVGASTVPGEASSACGPATASSVWYSLHAGSSPQRIAVELKAAGALDATVDVYRAVRSQLESVTCEQTEEEGTASLTFKAAKNGQYEIRVAALADSQLAGFTLNVFLPRPAINPPGAPLPASGASGQVDRIQNVNAAYALSLHSGVSYLVNLTTETKHGACVSASLFAPGTSSFESGQSLLRIECGGYQLFTPGPGQGGRYSLELTPSGAHIGVQRFHVQVARAGSDETAPGIALANYGVARGHLNGRGVQVLKLYRVDVHGRSNLTLRLHAPASAKFNLRLLNQDGGALACECGGSGSLNLQRKLPTGRYYVAVSVRGASSGSFALERESRTITHTSAFFIRATAPAGRPTPIRVRVSPTAAGIVTVNIDRFDPVFGWQFYRQVRTRLQGGRVSIPFTAPAVGRWRATAAYGGSRVSSPSSVGFTYLLVS